MDIRKGQIKDDINVGIDTTGQSTNKDEMNQERVEEIQNDINEQGEPSQD